VLITPRRLLLIVGLALLTASPSRGEVGLLVLEPLDALGFFTRVGHTGTYFVSLRVKKIRLTSKRRRLSGLAIGLNGGHHGGFRRGSVPSTPSSVSLPDA
jgi:hypothetical protein